MSMISERDIVTTNEIKDICERFGKKPSERKRIIIARSGESAGEIASRVIKRNN